MDRGVILSNLTLVLQRVTRETHGEYTCRAANTEGSVSSNMLQLDIQCEWQSAVIRISALMALFNSR